MNTNIIKKPLFILYVLVLLYICMILLFGNLKFIIFDDFLHTIFNPHIFFIFNVLGMYPLIFLLAIKVYLIDIKDQAYKLLHLSYLFGGFIIYPILLTTSLTSKGKIRETKYINIIFIVLSAYTLFLLFYVELFGDFSYFLYMFKNDIFIHIMTIDFIITYIFSIYLSYKKEKNWYLSFIPVLGFLFLLNSSAFIIHNKS